MSCTATAPCGGILRPDETFNRQAEAEGVNVRRWACLCAHSFIVGPPPALRGHVVTPAKCCTRCGLPIPLAEPGDGRRTKHVACCVPDYQVKLRRSG